MDKTPVIPRNAAVSDSMARTVSEVQGSANLLSDQALLILSQIECSGRLHAEYKALIEVLLRWVPSKTGDQLAEDERRYLAQLPLPELMARLRRM